MTVIISAGYVHLSTWARARKIPSRTAKWLAMRGLMSPPPERDHNGRYFVDSEAVRLAGRPRGGVRVGSGRHWAVKRAAKRLKTASRLKPKKLKKADK